jgi:exportin-1
MACDTFLKIALKCKRKFVTQQKSESQPFLAELTDTLSSIIEYLEAHQIQAFTETVATMLMTRGPSVTLDRSACQANGTAEPDVAWLWSARGVECGIADRAFYHQGIIHAQDGVGLCCGTLCHFSTASLFMDMLNVYKVYSERISAAVAQQGAIALNESCTDNAECQKNLAAVEYSDSSGQPGSRPDLESLPRALFRLFLIQFLATTNATLPELVIPKC